MKNSSFFENVQSTKNSKFEKYLNLKNVRFSNMFNLKKCSNLELFKIAQILEKFSFYKMFRFRKGK
jgi:hypothetical protein